VTRDTNKAREYRKKGGLSHHRKTELMRNIIQETSMYIKENEEKEYQAILSVPRCKFMIQEMMRLIFPAWIRTIKTFKSRSKPKKSPNIKVNMQNDFYSQEPLA
jgi:hypothetical protein